MNKRLPAALGSTFAAILMTSILINPTLAQARHQRAPLSLGTVDPSSITKLQSCPSGFDTGMTCFTGKVQACANADDLGFTYGIENPQGEIAGTIVFLDGGGDTTPFGDATYAETYLQQGYQVVSLAWDTDWEFTNGATGNNIQAAACRPATFLQYVYEDLNSRGGMCAQGSSAGSGAVAYSLAWYGASSYLDNVELLSGPVFSDIEQGCVVPSASTVQVCADGQYGCVGPQWPDSPAYVIGDQTSVSGWSGIAGCNGVQATSAADNAAWKQMSIVDGTDNPTFNYPQTAMAGWLCSDEDDPVQNNSAAEGEFFYQQFTSPNQTAQYSVTRVNHCDGPEGVTEGQVPNGETGFAAISNDMLGACFNRHSGRKTLHP
jgi:hypothetical protein